MKMRNQQSPTESLPRHKVIVLIPTRGIVSAALTEALVSNTEGHHLILRMVNRVPVDVARNRLAAMALAAADDASLFPPEANPYVFWIDSDAFFLNGTFSLMLQTLETNPPIDLLAALFGPRSANRGATAFRKAGDRRSFLHPDSNFERGDLVDVDQVGLHFVLHRISLLRALGEDPFGGSTAPNTDDAAFCGRIRHGNGRITVATGIPVFHVDDRNGAAYSPGIAACVIDGATINTNALEAELPTEKRSYGDRVDRAIQTSSSPERVP
jgi:hypothetical protein